MRLLVTLLAFAAALGSTAVLAFFAVIFLSGPHGGVLPPAFHGATLALAWLCVLVVPLFVARRVWRRYSRGHHPGQSRDEGPPR
jgi:hypothetical protein